MSEINIFFGIIGVNGLLIAHLAYFVRVLYDMYLAKMTIKNRSPHEVEISRSKSDMFSFNYYMQDNLLKWILTYVSMWMMIVITVESFLFFQTIQWWNPVLAGACGFSSLEGIKIFENKFKKKLEEVK